MSRIMKIHLNDDRMLLLMRITASDKENAVGKSDVAVEHSRTVRERTLLPLSGVGELSALLGRALDRQHVLPEDQGQST